MTGEHHEPGTGSRGSAAAPRPGEAATPGDAAVLLSGVVRLISAHPALLLEHLQAHAALLALEVAAGAARLKRQALWWAGAFFSGLAAMVLSGVAVLLWWMHPLSATPSVEATASAWGMATPWLLAAVPAVPGLLALVCVAGGLGLFSARLPAQPGALARLKTDVAGLRGTTR